MKNVYDEVFVVGTGRVASECLRTLKAKGVDAVYIPSEDSGGYNSLNRLCEQLGITCEDIPRTLLKEYFMGITSESLIISAHNSYVFPAEVTAKPNLTIYNMHIALLPKYRGMNAATWAIFNREDFAGVTWHVVSAKIDSGAILLQERVRIEEDDTAMKLMLKCFNAGCRLFRENLEGFLSRGLLPHEAASSGENRLYLAKDLPNGGYADLSWDFGQLWAFLRSMDYTGANIMPLPRITIGGKDFEVTSYKIDDKVPHKGVAELRINTYLGGGALY